MFDALIGSMDWGSGFLDIETIESILIIAELAGFDLGDHRVDVDVPGLVLLPSPVFPPDAIMPYGGWPSDRPEVYSEAQRKLAEFRNASDTVWSDNQARRTEAITAWRAQIQAKARAMAKEIP